MRGWISPLAGALLGCFALAALSLFAPFGPVFDPWAWLVWGRELVQLDLDTSAGPSWKPLPALIAAPLSAFGDAAPDLWLALARAAWLAVPVLAWRLAARLEGSGGSRSIVAGAVAAFGVVLIADEFTPWARQAAGGLSEPLLVALALGAIEAALRGRTHPALLLAFAACLVRPEAWPFALAYGWREARSGRLGWPTLATGAVAVLALWLVPDLLAAGDPLEGAERARGADNSPFEALCWALEMPLAALWMGVVPLVVLEARSRPLSPALLLAAGAAGWILLVAAMTAIGYAGLPRFMAPAGAVACALGGAGLVRGVAGLRRKPALAAGLAVAATVALGIQGAVRIADIPGQLDRARDDAALTDRLLELAADQPAALDGCPPLWTSDFLVQTPLAWGLDLPIGEITTTLSVAPDDGTILVGPRSDTGLAARIARHALPVAEAGDWRVYATGACVLDPGR